MITSGRPSPRGGSGRKHHSHRKDHKEDYKASTTPIKDNSKHVHFKDEVEGNDLCDVVIIESYKKYYNTVNDSSCACTCQIF